MTQQDADVVLRYHEATKHHYHRFAPSLGYMDWANQPDPFRRFAGARVVQLPFVREDDAPRYSTIFDPASVPPAPVDLRAISELFFRSLALSAWKEYRGARWSLRCNPSSGNLHPTEGYLVCGPVAGLSDRPGVYHYAAREHALEERCSFAGRTWRDLTRALPPETLLLGLSSIHWREAWKYGERAYRYCQHDIGHAVAALSFAAASLGWCVRWLDALSDADVATCLGLERGAEHPREIEYPGALLVACPAGREGQVPHDLPEAALAGLGAAAWRGTPNRLSADHVDWEMITAVTDACRKPRTAPAPCPPAVSPAAAAELAEPECDRTARAIFRQRRSAVAMDGRTAIDRTAFERMLGSVAPRRARPPLDALRDRPAVHLALFVHRVDGMEPGLYFLPRCPGPEELTAALQELRRAMRPQFLWEVPRGWPAEFPLYLLVPIDCRSTAMRLSCDQAIAGDGAFSLGMLAEYEPPIREHGAWYYRRLFWETGIIGQVLYLEAEAAGVRSTGIGCFYDDPVHELLGLEDRGWQSFYHFTVGGAVWDPRLQTHPAYEF